MYNKDSLFEQAKQILSDESKREIVFVDDVAVALGISRTTLYSHFPVGSPEMTVIDDLLRKNRSYIKQKMRKKWFKSEQPALQISLYKLIGTEDEAHRLNGTKTENVNVNVEQPLFTDEEDEDFDENEFHAENIE